MKEIRKQGLRIRKQGLKTENKVFIRKQDFWSPYLQTMIDNQLNDCEVCAENNESLKVLERTPNSVRPIHKESENGCETKVLETMEDCELIKRYRLNREGIKLVVELVRDAITSPTNRNNSIRK
ncbi:hypothetical protein N1851_034090 [Merluccius polli]|uniref:Uncharacterized protein n=1 Tax=Merluccius polli TaxID=89951 RepID=A0AA47M0H6_MERPO|nr:hypothetical protein N1851_034090 [Merluccius polli]